MPRSNSTAPVGTKKVVLQVSGVKGQDVSVEVKKVVEQYTK
jgi:hypothetical protein